MCGLVGMAGKIGLKEGKMFRDMLVFDQVRGFDSTGVFMVDIDGNKLDIEKEVGGAENLWTYYADSEFDEKGIILKPKTVLMGHNRAATMGATNKMNAHPFNYGDITGSHNGTLNYWNNLEDANKLDVDSKAVFNTINKKGIDHLWDSLYGAAALTWWDEKDSTLNIIRNSQRPLYLAFSEDNSCVFWASEPWMIEIAASRAKVGLKERVNKEGGKEDTIFQLAINHLHTFKPTKTAHGLHEVREIEKKSYTQGMGFWTKKKTRGGLVTGGEYNAGWAKGLFKASKEFRGKEVVLSGVYSFIDNKTYKARKVIVFKFKHGGNKLFLYPKSKADYNIWVDRLQDFRTYTYKIKQRPRAETTTYIGSRVYSVSTDGVSFVSSTYVVEPPKAKNVVTLKTTPPTVTELKPIPIDMQHYNRFVTKSMWHYIMKDMKPSYACSCCMETVTEDEQKELEWVSHDRFLCAECSKNCAEDDKKLARGL